MIFLRLSPTHPLARSGRNSLIKSWVVPPPATFFETRSMEQLSMCYRELFIPYRQTLQVQAPQDSFKWLHILQPHRLQSTPVCSTVSNSQCNRTARAIPNLSIYSTSTAFYPSLSKFLTAISHSVLGHSLKTPACIFPYSSYRATFEVSTGRWQTIRLPWEKFIGYGPGAVDKPFHQKSIARAAIVALGEERKVHLAVAHIRFYNE